jgi:hypothetical protein
MILAGIVITFLGFLISIASLTVTASTSGRMVMVLIGICVSLGGIVGVITRAYAAKAIWRK